MTTPVRIAFSVTTYFDSVYDMSETQIEELKKYMDGKENIEITEESHPELHSMLIESCSSESFDYVMNDDIEIEEAERMPNFPMENKTIPL